MNKRNIIFHTLKTCAIGFLLGFFISYSVDHFLGYHAPGSKNVCDYEDL